MANQGDHKAIWIFMVLEIHSVTAGITMPPMIDVTSKDDPNLRVAPLAATLRCP